MAEASKLSSTKKQVKNTPLDLGDKTEKKTQIFDLSYFNDYRQFHNGWQNYLLFQPVFKYFQFLVALLLKV